MPNTASKEVQYDNIALDYQESKQLPFRKHIEEYTLFHLLSPLAGASVLDLACGEGIYSRKLKLNGAGSVIGVDLSSKMVELATSKEKEQPLGIRYLVSDVAEIGSLGQFDIVLCSYLLNYARTVEELDKFCRAIFANLKPNGRVVGFNDNPANSLERYPFYRKYGFTKAGASPRREGDAITYTMYNAGDKAFTFENYYLHPSRYDEAFAKAGFASFRWQRPLLSPEGKTSMPAGFWNDFLDDSPLIGIEALR